MTFADILAREIKKQQEAAKAAANTKGVYGNQNQRLPLPDGLLRR